LIKIRNKRIALLLVLAMLATMFVGVGTTSAANNYIDVDGNYTWVSNDKDDQPQPAGDIKVLSNSDLNNITATDVDTLFVEVALPDDVTFEDYDFGGLGTWSEVDTDDSTIVYSSSDAVDAVTAADQIVFSLTNISLDIDKDVTGDIKATVRVYGKNGTQTVFDETETPTIAKVSSGDITVSAASAKTLYVGSDQTGAKITFKEIGPKAFSDMDKDIKLAILTSGVTWDYSGLDWNPTYCSANDTSDSTDKVLYMEVSEDANDRAQISKLVVIPSFKVSPAAEGEVKVKVSGDGIETTTFVVGKVGAGDVDVTVEDADEDFVYRGQFATFDDVVVTLDPGLEISEDDWFSITLPDGLKFADVSEPVDAEAPASYQELIKNDKTAWFTFDGDADDEIDLTDFVIVADADAVLGDLAITFAGAVEGTYVIGQVKDAFTVTTAPFALQTGLTSVAGADIVITETADGALKPSGEGYTDIDDKDYEYGWFSLVLPAGVTWDGVPTVKVTEGDLEIDDVWIGEDFRELYFEISEISNLESTITLSDVQYTVLSQPGLGDLNILIGGGVGDYGYNIASSKPLVKTAIGTVATHPTAAYVIGAPTFTVNGAVQNVVTPSYIKDGRTYLAIRDIATGLGIDPMNVLWDAVGQKVTLVKGDKIVQVTIGSNTMYVNGIAIAMDVAPEINNGRTMLPAAFIAQAFGASASWDALTQTVTIK
jgi:hypothetical protein